MIRLIYIFLLTLFLAFELTNGQIGSWENIDYIPASFSGSEAVVIDSTIYILGGNVYVDDTTQGFVTTIYAYKPLTKQWSIVGNMKLPRNNFLADKLGTKIYYFGGEDTDKREAASGMLEMFDTKTNTSYFADSNKVFNRYDQTGLISDSIFYVIGGVLYNPPVQPVPWSSFSYDINSKKTPFGIQNPDLNYFKGQMSAMLGNNIYVFGGVFRYMLNDISYFNINSGSLKEYKPGWFMSSSRARGRAVAVGKSQVMIIGGYDEREKGLNTAELYTFVDSLKQPARTPIPNMHFRRKDFVAVKFQNYVYIFGGTDESGRVVNIVERIYVNLTTNIVDLNKQPLNYKLEQNYPNPFNPSTIISYSVPQRSFVTLKVFNVLGSQVAVLANEIKEAGNYSANFNATGLPSGVYFYRIQAAVPSGVSSGSDKPASKIFSETRKMVLVR